MGGGAWAYWSSYVSADFRLERPGPIELDVGAATKAQSGSCFRGAPEPYTLTGRVDDDTIYLKTHAAGTRPPRRRQRASANPWAWSCHDFVEGLSV